MRFVCYFLSACILFFIPIAKSQNLSGLAQIDTQNSYVQDRSWRQIEIHLTLSQSVPYRVYQLNNPMRIVVEFNEVLFDGLEGDIFDQSKRVSAVEFGSLGNGWSRLALMLTEPLSIKSVEMTYNKDVGNSALKIWSRPVTSKEFSQASQVPLESKTEENSKDVLFAKNQNKDAQILIVLDPGHGGLDPGAVVGNLREADLMLLLALELKEALIRTQGINVAMTRTGDTYPTLSDRLRFTNRNQADLFISLHADSVSEGDARGTTIYTLSETASDKTSARLAKKHDRSALLIGLDLIGTEDNIADVLIDLARQDNLPRSKALATTTIQELKRAIGSVNAMPLRHANFSVLKSPDVPSILIEVGFMSTQSDLDNLLDQTWRTSFVGGVRNGIIRWIGEDSIVAPLRRQ